MNAQMSNTAFTGATIGGLASPTLPAVIGGMIVAILVVAMIKGLQK